MYAMNQNDERALVEMGMNYQRGWKRVVEQDLKKAFECFEKAVTLHNSLDALFELGRCFMEGLGIEKDEIMARMYWRRAANQGCDRAQSALLTSTPSENH